MGGVTGPQYHQGGSGGAAGGSGSGYTPGSAGETSTQVGNHPIPLTPTILPVNSPGSFGNDGGVNQTDSAPYFGSSGGGGAGGAGGDAEGTVAGEGGIGLYYNIADGTTSVGYAGGGAGANDSDFPQGTSVVFGGGDTNPSPHQSGPFYPGLPGAVNSGGGGAGGRNTPPISTTSWRCIWWRWWVWYCCRQRNSRHYIRYINNLSFRYIYCKLSTCLLYTSDAADD